VRRHKEGPRRAPRRAPTTVLVYCGAARTERSYVDGLKAMRRRSGTSVLVRGSGKAPVQFAAGVGDAVKRARDLDPTGTEHRRNPSTNVLQLVERILEGT
jgi:hypothetical protein